MPTHHQSSDELETLDQSYHEYRVLRDKTDIQARVSAVGVDENDRIRICLSIMEGKIHTLSFNPTFYNIQKLEDLYHSLGLQFTRELDNLVDETLMVRFDDDLSKISLQDVGISDKRTSIVENSNVGSYDGELDEKYLTSFRRLKRYESRHSTVNYCPVSITEVSTGNGSLILELDLCGQSEEWAVPVPDEITDSKYESLIEEIGEGSVKQIEGGVIYATRSTTQRSYFNFDATSLGSITDEFSQWWLFLKNTDAVSGSRTIGSEDVPESLKPYDEYPDWAKRASAAVAFGGLGAIIFGVFSVLTSFHIVWTLLSLICLISYLIGKYKLTNNGYSLEELTEAQQQEEKEKREAEEMIVRSMYEWEAKRQLERKRDFITSVSDTPMINQEKHRYDEDRE